MAVPSSSIEEGAERPPLCAAAPVLWSLLPLMAGIALGNRAHPWLAAAVLAAGITGVVAAIRHQRPRTAIAALSVLGGLALGHLSAEHPHPGWADQPPREAQLQIRIEELFNARKPGRIAGVATIMEVNLPVDTVSGRTAAFYLESGALESTPPAIGHVLSCRAVLTPLHWLEEVDDYQLYLLNRDIFLSLNQGLVLQVRAPPGPVERLRQRLFLASQALLSHGSLKPEDPGNVLASMLLGNRALLTDARVELYRQTGTYHLFAVSGLHVGSVALCLLFLGRLARLRGAFLLIPVLAATWGYVWLTGSSPSAVRAGIMISCVSLARSLLRQPHIFPALVLSAWLVLLWQPTQLFHLGFQLSYGVVASIVLVGLPLSRELRLSLNRRMERVPGGGRSRRLVLKFIQGGMDLACVSLSAGLASMPLIIQHFELFTPAGVILGILLNPLATLCVMAGSITLLCAPALGTTLAGWLPLATWPVIRIMEFLLHGCLQVPGAVSNRFFPWPPTGTCVLLTMLLAAWLLQQARMRSKTLPAAAHLVPLAIVLGGLSLTQLSS